MNGRYIRFYVTISDKNITSQIIKYVCYIHFENCVSFHLEKFLWNYSQGATIIDKFLFLRINISENWFVTKNTRKLDNQLFQSEFFVGFVS